MVQHETFSSRVARVALMGTALVILFLIVAFTALPSRGIYGFQFQVIRDGRSVKIILRHGPEQQQWTTLLLTAGTWAARQATRGISTLSAWPAMGRTVVQRTFDRTLGKGMRMVTGSAQRVTYRLGRLRRRRS